MIRNLMIKGVKAFALSLVLIILGGVIYYAKKESGISFQDILFWVGAVPIVFFSVGQFGDFFGRGDSTYQLSRSVLKQSPNQRSLKDKKESRSKTSDGLVWIAAGLLTWLFSTIKMFF